jgi:hypothetical protein
MVFHPVARGNFNRRIDFFENERINCQRRSREKRSYAAQRPANNRNAGHRIDLVNKIDRGRYITISFHPNVIPVELCSKLHGSI